MDEKGNSDYEWEFQQWKGNKLQELKYHRAVCMMICGYTIKDVAKELNASQKTVERFFNNPEFNDNLTRAMQLTFRKALSKAALYADRAMDLLLEIAEDINQPTKYRLQAISQINDVCFKGKLDDCIDVDAKPQSATFKMNNQQNLLSMQQSVNYYAGLTGNAEIQNKLNKENTLLIWNELYPDEPYPNDENLRQHFNTNELDFEDN